jgi:hypothetical protein
MTIWRVEHGAIQDVKGQVLAKMALALETTTDYLLGLRDDEQPDSRTATMQDAPQPKRKRPRKAAPVA